jgi:sarcosine oxidase subunit gamma
MSEAVSALKGAAFDGYVRVSEVGLRGMVTLRADLSDAKVKAAVKKLAGVDLPGVRKIALKGGRGAGWMSPDELLILVPYGEAGAAVAALSKALVGVHHLSADVSDARAAFRVEGKAAREVMAKLSPTDLAPDHFGEGELRRTRLAQVAAAFWIEDGGFTVVCFRSVAAYVFELLKLSATPGGEVGLWG